MEAINQLIQNRTQQQQQQTAAILDHMQRPMVETERRYAQSLEVQQAA